MRMLRVVMLWVVLTLLTAEAATAQAAKRMALTATDTIAVTDTGAGPAVVIVPGLLGGAYSFRKVIAPLVAAGYRVLVVEPLGTGESSRPAHGDYSLEAQAARIEQVLATAGVDSAIFLCHSVGGSMCYRLGLRQEHLVRGIVAVNAGPDEEAATSGLRFALKFVPLMRIIGAARTARSRVRDGLIDSSADPAWVTAEVVAEYTRPHADFDAVLRALRGMAAARERTPLVSRLGQLAAPVRLLIGTGTKNGVTSARDIDLLTNGIEDITVQHIANAGQYVHEENPAAVVAAVQALHAELRER